MLSLEKQNSFREAYCLLNPGWQPATEVYASMVRERLRPDSRVLDLGCGRGGLVEQLDHPLNQVVGIDPDWLSLAEHRLPLPRTQGFSYALPFADGVFDVVFCSWLLEHLARPGLDFAEIMRVTRPGGAFIFITPNKRHPLSWLNAALGQLGRWQGWLVQHLYGRASDDTFPTYYHANSHSDLTKLAAQSNSSLDQLHPIPDPTYLAFTPLLFRLFCTLEKAIPSNRKLHLVGLITRKA